MSLSITKPLPKPKAEEEAKEAKEEQDAKAVEDKDVLTHLRREGMRIPTKTQEMTRVFGPAVDAPPRLHP